MPIYYRGPQVLITDDTFEVRHPCPHRFALEDLREIWVVPAGPDRLAIGAVVVAVVILMAIIACWRHLASPARWLAALGMIIAPCVVAWACLRLNRTQHELWAYYHGYRIRIFACADPYTFGQVKRALTRALEG